MNEEERSERLKAVGLTPTIQRLAVLEFVEKSPSHPTAERVYAGVRKHFPSISKATVYNALEAMEKLRVIRKLTIEREAARYDGNPLPHPHFLCRKCGTLYDVALPCPIRPGDVVLGHHIETVHTYLYGICAHCRNEDRETENDSNPTPPAACTARRKDA